RGGARGGGPAPPAGRAARRVVEAGGRALAEEVAAGHLSAALAVMDEHLPRAAALRALCVSVTNRSH
ncbi:hypothetical protein ABT267_41065, partial [Nonomuraea sp. NPDC001023]